MLRNIHWFYYYNNKSKINIELKLLKTFIKLTSKLAKIIKIHPHPSMYSNSLKNQRNEAL